jgi:hypothetical protein
MSKEEHLRLGEIGKSCELGMGDDAVVPTVAYLGRGDVDVAMSTPPMSFTCTFAYLDMLMSPAIIPMTV